VRAQGRRAREARDRRGSKPALAATLEQEVQAQQQLAETDDFKEGARAFFEKRQPDFAGR
jgi:enoyl-CoA hydratase/carnithine racemase